MKRIIGTLLFFLLPSIALAGKVVSYDTLRMSHQSDTVKVVLDLSDAAKFRYFSLKNPDRFVVDLTDTVVAGRKAALDFSSTPIKSIRSGVRGGGNLRLVFDLSRTLTARAFMVPPSGGKSHRLVVEFKGVPVARPAAPAQPALMVQAEKPSVPVAKVAARQEAASVAPPVVPVERPQVTKRALSPDTPVRDIVVAIDAGHGGVDPGASGHRGTEEKDVVLAIARQLEKLVAAEKGMRPVLIRDGDYFLTLRKRIDKARAAKADVFVSIHADAFPDPRAKGSSVYTLSEHGATTEAAMFLANRENAADLVGGVSLDDKDDMLASVLLDLSQSATIEASMDVATRVLKGLKSVSRTHKSHVEQAGFTVLKAPDIPSILVETAFISNPREEKNLLSKHYQSKLATAMLDGIRSYFVSNPPPNTYLAARQHVIQQGETLTAIAQQYDVSIKSLRLSNELKSDAVNVGQVLHIPIGG